MPPVIELQSECLTRHERRSQKQVPTRGSRGMFKASVVIPTHNRAAPLIRAIESVLAQTYPACEVIVVDDGSTDGTEEALRRYTTQKLPSNSFIRYIYQRQQGPAVARNTGLAEATGGWIAFLDSDDCWLPEKLEWQVRAVERFSDVSGACVTDASYTNNPLLKKSAFQQAGKHFDDLIGIVANAARCIAYGHHGMYLQTLIVRTEIIRNVGGFDPSLRLNEDADFLFRLARRTSVCYVNKPLVEIDRTPDRAVGLIELARKEDFRLQLCQYMYEKWLKEDGKLGPDIRERILRRLQEVHTGWASWHLINGNYEKARQALSSAMRYNFTGKVAFKWLLANAVPSLARKIVLKRRERIPDPTLF